jgi:hypothetical protein
MLPTDPALPTLSRTKAPSFALPQRVLFRAQRLSQRSQREKERASQIVSAFALRDVFRDRGISEPAVHVRTGAGVRDMLQIPSRLMLVCCCLTIIIDLPPSLFPRVVHLLLYLVITSLSLHPAFSGFRCLVAMSGDVCACVY